MAPSVCVVRWVIEFLLDPAHTRAIMEDKPHKKISTTNKIVIIIAGFIVLVIIASVAIWALRSTKTVDSFQACKDAGGTLLESYPEQCLINGKTYADTAALSGDSYVGLSEQAALEKAKGENKTARVVERDGEPQAVTMDFLFGRLNLYIKDGVVYKVEVEGLAEDN